MNLFYNNPIVMTCRRAAKATALGVCLLLAFVPFSNAQIVPQLSFQNPQLISGTDMQDGAVYRFSNVTTGIDALVTIVGRSHPKPGGSNPTDYVDIYNMDITSTGPINAFQPDVSFVGNAGNKDWWVDFSVHFVAAGTTNELPSGSGIIYKVTTFDTDGDGTGVREYIQGFGATSYQTSSSTQLTVSPVSRTYGSTLYSGTEFLGPVAAVGSYIDTTAADVSATLNYANQNTVYFRTGARNANSNWSDPDRYYSLLFNNFLYIAPGPLPVNLLSFTAKLNKNNTALDWTTANEVNFSHFVVQRGTDGKSFSDIGTVAGKQSSGSANTVYAFTDNANVQATIIYYRLKMVDVDGTYKYSEIKLVRTSGGGNQASVLVYPNPVVSELRVTIPDSWQSKKISFTIYNSIGNAIIQRTINSAGQTEIFNLAAVTPGLYTVRVIKDSETIVKQFVKN